MPKYILEKGSRGKKWKVSGEGKTIQFGAEGYEDFTTSKSENKKSAYIARHKKNEDWNKSGIESAGFWAKHLLWNKPTLSASIKATNDMFGIHIVRKR
tara:strand:+ start:276 stop:569 length:294 start_codon:yes stop_codon:yes gene_type:complete